ncbi:MAG: hypothetical protein ABEI39_04205 [Halobacteriales archaeon]
MADEFIKGLGILTAAGLGWLVLSGWYNTPSFESTRQLIEAAPQNPDVYGQLALVARDALFWFAILGALVFWVVIPGMREVRAAMRGEAEEGSD